MPVCMPVPVAYAHTIVLCDLRHGLHCQMSIVRTRLLGGSVCNDVGTAWSLAEAPEKSSMQDGVLVLSLAFLHVDR